MNPEKMLTAILKNQKGMSSYIKSLIMTVTDVKNYVETLKPISDKVDDLSRKYADMEKHLTAVESNTSKI